MAHETELCSNCNWRNEKNLPGYFVSSAVFLMIFAFQQNLIITWNISKSIRPFGLLKKNSRCIIVYIDRYPSRLSERECYYYTVLQRKCCIFWKLVMPGIAIHNKWSIYPMNRAHHSLTRYRRNMTQNPSRALNHIYITNWKILFPQIGNTVMLLGGGGKPPTDPTLLSSFAHFD